MDFTTTSSSTCTDSIASNSIATPRQNELDNSLRSTSSFSSWSLNVSFSQTITVREIPSRRDYTPDEIIKTWYTNDDIRSWKSDCRKMVRNEIPIDCHRGLEDRSPEVAIRKRKTKEAARMAVLQGQRLPDHQRPRSD